MVERKKPGQPKARKNSSSVSVNINVAETYLQHTYVATHRLVFRCISKLDDEVDPHRGLT